jgi:hypothetical protein
LVSHIGGGGSFLVLGIGTEIAVLAVLLAYFKRRGWF